MTNALFSDSGNGTGLLQEFIDESGLAMIDVGDNGDISEFLNHGNAAYMLYWIERAQIIQEKSLSRLI